MASGMLELQTVSSLSSATYITAPSDQIPRGLLLLARLSSVNSSSVTRSSVGKRICSAGQLVDRAPQPPARQRAALWPANPQLGSSRAWPAAERGHSPGRRRDLALRLILHPPHGSRPGTLHGVRPELRPA